MTASKKAAPRKSTAKTTAKPTARTAAKTAAKTAAPRKAVKARTAKKTVVVKPSISVKPAVQGVTLNDPMVLGKKQLIEDVVARSGIKKKDAKPVIEAMLGVLGEAIGAGKNLNLQPFGKITLQKQNEKASARVSVVRIRQPNHLSQKAVKDPLAEAAE